MTDKENTVLICPRGIILQGVKIEDPNEVPRSVFDIRGPKVSVLIGSKYIDINDLIDCWNKKTEIPPEPEKAE